MCGIAGIFRPEGAVTVADSEQVARMVALQAHRGPDDDGIVSRTGAVLGHRRLSIIDLTQGGHQPMTSRNGKCAITYNGEIYNHVDLRHELELAGHSFHSTSDTEVILAGFCEWGIERLLGHLRGMFAFAIHDSRGDGNGQIIMARDRLGIKPLYFSTRIDHSVCFASEVRALVRSGAVRSESDSRGMLGFLMYGSVPAPMTAVQNVRCLEPGTYVVVTASGSKRGRYWDVRATQHQDPPAQSVGDLLAQAVRYHMVSDVPVGVFLSGGLDSAALVLLASQVAEARLHSLTVTLPNSPLSEGAQARETAELFRTEHTEVSVTGEDFGEALPQLLGSVDQPTCDGVNTYLVARAAGRAGLKVVLSGLGADEVFWGYNHYRLAESRQAQILGGLPGPMRQLGSQALVTYGRLRREERWNRASYLGRNRWEDGLYLLSRGLFSVTEAAALLGTDRAEADSVLDESLQVAAARPDDSCDGKRLNYIEFNRYLHDQLLRDSDVFSMAHSVELRVPFLDHLLVEAVQAKDASHLLSRNVNKPALQGALLDPRLREIASRPKRGFTMPMADWITQHGSDLEALTLSTSLFDNAAVSSCWRSFRAGRLHWSKPWSLTVAAASQASYAAADA